MKTLRILILILFPIVGFAQKSTYKGFPSLIWPKLYDITFVKATDDLGEFDKPVFTDKVKALNGKLITLPGYMVPFENGIKGAHFMFSSMPLNACFFCGVGGPETVVEVFSKEVVTYTEKPIEIKGILRLNEKDPEKMIYVIEGAEIMGEAGF
ncbi:hypothetical protein [Pseudochryseolinea flava]|uniref:DUF3299 domain-containing protein n=1 Tax=Pseudochryseolinea flava TaxID=2059302 RepID=A0A364Y903_9BACT|nr:hypothetical protein [Pseudochryseolinea flava]RAW02722.1 hypothetical protein DQQ10_01040 [Pseudochryseolinea flava]